MREDCWRVLAGWHRRLRSRVFWQGLRQAWRLALPAAFGYLVLWLFLPLPSPRLAWLTCFFIGPGWALCLVRRRGPRLTQTVYLVDRARGWQELLLTASSLPGQPEPSERMEAVVHRAEELTRRFPGLPGRTRWQAAVVLGLVLSAGWWLLPASSRWIRSGHAAAQTMTESEPSSRFGEQTGPASPARRANHPRANQHRLTPPEEPIAPPRSPTRTAPSQLLAKLGLLKGELGKAVRLPGLQTSRRKPGQALPRTPSQAPAHSGSSSASNPGDRQSGLLSGRRKGKTNVGQGTGGPNGPSASAPHNRSSGSDRTHLAPPGQSSLPPQAEETGKGTRAGRGQSQVVQSRRPTVRLQAKGPTYQLKTSLKKGGFLSLAAKARLGLPARAALASYQRQAEEALASEIYPGQFLETIEAYFASWD